MLFHAALQRPVLLWSYGASSCFERLSCSTVLCVVVPLRVAMLYLAALPYTAALLLRIMLHNALCCRAARYAMLLKSFVPLCCLPMLLHQTAQQSSVLSYGNAIPCCPAVPGAAVFTM